MPPRGRGGARPRPPATKPALPPHLQAVRIARAVPGLIKHLPHHRPWMVTLLVIATTVVLGTCGLGSYLLVRDDNTVIGTDPNATPTIPLRDITSRKADPNPLTAADVFDATEIVADPSIPPYKRVGKPQVATNCRVAATADVGRLLVQLGCNQVVRATFTSPDGGYLVTAGVFNLRDADSAVDASVQLGRLVSTTNRLTGYISAKSTQILGRAPTTSALYPAGHFLVYIVVARKNGKSIDTDDAHVKVIVYDILERYLRDTVIQDWATVKDAAAPEPS